MPVWFILLLIGTGGIVAARKLGGSSSAHFAAGKFRICFPPGVAPNPSILRAIFDEVTDAGGGCFNVTVSREMSVASLPPGMQIQTISVSGARPAGRVRMRA